MSLLAGLGPFPSLHRNESSLVSSPAGAGEGLAGLGRCKGDAGRHRAPDPLARCRASRSLRSGLDVTMRSRLLSIICARRGSLPACAMCACIPECPPQSAGALACLTASLSPCPGSPLSDGHRWAPQQRDEPHHRHRCHPDRYRWQMQISSLVSSELSPEQLARGCMASPVLPVPHPTPACLSQSSRLPIAR